MATQFVGSWKLYESENFDEYMKSLNVSLPLRKIGATTKPTQEIKINGDKWTIKTLSTFKNTEVSFTLGEEIEETTIDGRKVKSLYRLDGDKLVNTQTGPTGNKGDLVREIVNGELVLTLTNGNIVCKRKYKSV